MKRRLFSIQIEIKRLPISKSSLATDAENCFSLKSFDRSPLVCNPPSNVMISFGDGTSNVLS